MDEILRNFKIFVDGLEKKMEKRKKDFYKVPFYSWCPDIEASAYEQIEHLVQLPFAFHHVAIMPDCHAGFGMPIGGVLATKGVIIPSGVGVDIGCGMAAVKTSLKDIPNIKEVLGEIRQVIPVGKNHHADAQPKELMPNSFLGDFGHTLICKQEYQSATHQLGTLGGGNHFHEFQKDEDGFVWIMIHSGSRNLGKKVADYYDKKAKELNKQLFSEVPPSWGLAFLPMDHQLGIEYFQEMNFCVEFAFANRKLMMDRTLDILLKHHKNATFEPMINIAHNYAAIEVHYGEYTVVHRKGATLARLGVTGIIPGSQGTSSYIVQGLGNIESFGSCSHGAGRTMSRSKARGILNLDEEIARLDEQGIIHGIRNQSDLDEAASAYKDIDVVMENQSDLVKIVTKLKPIAVIKG